MDDVDIVERITALMSCQANGCDNALGNSPSADFCSPECQQRWHESQADLPEQYKGADSGTGRSSSSQRLRRWGEIRPSSREINGLLEATGAQQLASTAQAVLDLEIIGVATADTRRTSGNP